MKYFISALFISSIITLQSCTKEETESNMGVKKNNPSGSNYFVAAGPEKPWRKWVQADGVCIDEVENCYPEDIEVGRIHLNSLTGAIESNEIIPFFQNDDNVEIFLPNDQPGTLIQNEIISGNYDVFVHDIGTNKVHIFYGPTPVSSTSFEYVFPAIIN